jgi:hypothetical protein
MWKRRSKEALEMAAERPLDKEKLDALIVQTVKFLDYSWKQRGIHRWLNIIVVVLGIGLGAAITLTAAWGCPLAIGLMGAAISVLVGLQNAFKFAEFAIFWEAKHNQAKVMRDSLRYKVRNDEQFQTVVDAWLEFRRSMIEEMPKSSGYAAPDKPGAGPST